MFDFGQANPEQRAAIQHTGGPLLIIAGPGTGKTFTIVRRTLYMIRERGIKPEQIMLATFTEKASKELITRISNELARQNIPANINDMYIGTFHAICGRLIKEHLEKTGMEKNYRVIDGFEQQYMVFRELISKDSSFFKIENLRTVVETKNQWGRKRSMWDQAGQICRIVNELTEELVETETLVKSPRQYVRVTGRIQACYAGLLARHNYLDFSGSQAEVYRLLRDHPGVLAELRDKIKYIMVDEYQDTNYIQEQIVFLLAGEEQNICVVGDDDQGLYRFRGATVRNILKFTENFEPGKCNIVTLNKNYRSNPDIIRFYGDWMNASEWGEYRLPKTIKAGRAAPAPNPAVVKITADGKDWKQENLDFLNMLRASGRVTDLNQIAFLFYSVRAKQVRELADFFEKNGVHVYSPRSNLFFEREEVKLLLGSLLLCFPKFVERLEERGFAYNNEALNAYYDDCLDAARDYFQRPEGAPLKAFIDNAAMIHTSSQKNTEYNFTGLVYRMFAFEPFQSILARNMKEDMIALRPARNLSTLVSCLGKYEFLYHIDCLKPGRLDKDVYYLFTSFFDCLKAGGISEYEDQSEYAPSGCVSFLTIHQSKGLEFPIVVVGSLDRKPEKRERSEFDLIRDDYYSRKQFEPSDTTAEFDFMRLYYTAFSRAQNLLVLTADLNAPEGYGGPSKWFRGFLAKTPDWNMEGFPIGEFTFDTVKDVNLKQAYSFTSHVSVYEECPRQYKFFKELGFSPARVTATIFGTLIHQTIEDMHRAVLRNEASLITDDNIRVWLNANYASISESEHIFLSQRQLDAAFRQALRYARRQRGRWDQIRESEVDISVVKPDYILKGTIDLIRGEGDTLEIVDFKSDKKPEPDGDSGRTERYKKQLQIYAHLVEERTGHPVSRLHLYYTGDQSDTPVITFENEPSDVEAAVREFDAVVRRITEKDFEGRAADCTVCGSCDFRYYCENADRRKPAARKFACTDREVIWAKETARKKYSAGKTRRTLRDIFLDDLAKNIVRFWLSGYDGLSITEYDCLRQDDFSNADNYDLVVNGRQVEVKAYLDKKVGCPPQELIARRKLFVKDKAPDVTIQVIFVSQKKLADHTDADTLVSELCGSCTAYVIGWVSAKEQTAAVRAGKAEIPLSDTHDMPELIESLRQCKGQIRLCELCGAIAVQRTNRSSGEKFWGCPNYQLHKRRRSPG